jgi:TonB family protein
MKYLAPALLLLAAATQANSAANVDWRWDREIQDCALQQTVSSGDTIEVSRTPGNDQTAIELIYAERPEIRPTRAESGKIRLDQNSSYPADVYAASDDWKRLHVRAVVQDEAFAKALENASLLGISHDKLGEFKAALRSASAAMAALKNCEDEKMRKWGIDPAAWRLMKSHPIPVKPLYEKFSSFDYPGMAAAYDVTGDVVARLYVTDDGHVKDCEAANPSKYNGFEMAVCAVLRTARFQPAIDASGKPAASPYVAVVSFRMQ